MIRFHSLWKPREVNRDLSSSLVDVRRLFKQVKKKFCGDWATLQN